MKKIVAMIAVCLMSGIAAAADLSIADICAKGDAELVNAYIASVARDFPNQEVTVVKAAYKAEVQSPEYANKLRTLLKQGKLQTSDFQF